MRDTKGKKSTPIHLDANEQHFIRKTSGIAGRIYVNGGFVLINNSSTHQLFISSLLPLLPQRLPPRLLPSVSPHALGETPRTLLVTGWQRDDRRGGGEHGESDRGGNRQRRRRLEAYQQIHPHYIRISNISSDRLKCKASIALPSCTNDGSGHLCLSDMVHLLKRFGLRKDKTLLTEQTLLFCPSKCWQISMAQWHLM